MSPPEPGVKSVTVTAVVPMSESTCVEMVAALGGTYAWTQSQYFVGHADEDVARTGTR